MATGGEFSLEEIQDHVTCPICFDIYKNPQELQCRHTVCEQCLANLRKKSNTGTKVTCPTCREESWMSNVRPDFKTSALTDWYQRYMKSQISPDAVKDRAATCKCNQCRKPATSFCKSCEQCLCCSCVVLHAGPKKNCQVADSEDIDKVRSGAVDSLQKCASKLELEKCKFVQTVTKLVDNFNSKARTEAEELQQNEKNIMTKVQQYFETEKARCNQAVDDQIKKLVHTHQDKLEELQTLQEAIQLTKQTDTKTLMHYTVLLKKSCSQALSELQSYIAKMHQQSTMTASTSSSHQHSSASQEQVEEEPQSTIQTLFSLVYNLRKKVFSPCKETPLQLNPQEEQMLQNCLIGKTLPDKKKGRGQKKDSPGQPDARNGEPQQKRADDFIMQACGKFSQKMDEIEKQYHELHGNLQKMSEDRQSAERGEKLPLAQSSNETEVSLRLCPKKTKGRESCA